MYFQLGVKESKEDFFNFDRELEAFNRELRCRETRMIVIKGVRRTGKSSLLRVGLAEADVPSLLLDARALGAFSPDQIFDLVAGSLSKLLEKHGAFKKLLEKVRGIKITGLEVEFATGNRQTLLEIFERLSEWGESEDRPVVLALDEAQEFRLVPKFDALLAHLYDYCRGIKLVLAGSEVGVLDRFLGRKRAGAPLFGRPYFEITMGRLPKEKAEEFLRIGFEQLGAKVKEEEISEAVEVFDGIIGWLTSYGYFASKLGHKEALSRNLEEGIKLVKEELNTFLVQRQQARTRYLYILKLLSSPMSWSELKRGLEVKLGRTISDKQLSHYLAELVDYSLVNRAENKYVLADPMLARAVLEMR